MEFKLVNGDYVLNSQEDFEICTGHEEVLERILFKLMCRRGGFAPKRELGSRLHLLLSEKKENRGVSARKYILEALEGEKGVVLRDVEVSETQEGLFVRAEFELDGIYESLAVNLA